MSGITLTIDDAEASRQLNRLVAAAENTEDVLHAIGAAMVQATKRRFDKETGPEGKKWARLSPRTAAQRVTKSGRRGDGHILVRKHFLYDSIVYETTSNRAVVIGTNMRYAAIHQFGGSVQMPERHQEINLSTGKGRKRFVQAKVARKRTLRVKIGAHTINIPARPYLGIDDADIAEITHLVEEHFREAAK